VKIGDVEIPEYVMWLLGVAGALCALLIRHWLQNNAAKSNRYASACEKYRSALLNIFSGLYPNPTDWPQNVDAKLRSIFPDLQKATEEFRHYLPWYKRIGFDRAWFKYRCATGRKIDTQCYHHYIGFQGQPDPKETFRKNVGKMLSYAK
jgi:hypothetical protein